MNTLAKLVSSCLLLPAALAAADAPRKECLGRLSFNVPESIEWATFSKGYTLRISQGGGHGFGLKVGADGDNARYGEFGAVVIPPEIRARQK